MPDRAALDAGLLARTLLARELAGRAPAALAPLGPRQVSRLESRLSRARAGHPRAPPQERARLLAAGAATWPKPPPPAAALGVLGTLDRGPLRRKSAFGPHASVTAARLGVANRPVANAIAHLTIAPGRRKTSLVPLFSELKFCVAFGFSLWPLALICLAGCPPGRPVQRPRRSRSPPRRAPAPTTSRGGCSFRWVGTRRRSPSSARPTSCEPTRRFCSTSPRPTARSGAPERAVFFYRRYLTTHPNPPNRPEVEAQIALIEPTIPPDGAERPHRRSGCRPPRPARVAAGAPAVTRERVVPDDERGVIGKWWFWTAVGHSGRGGRHGRHPGLRPGAAKRGCRAPTWVTPGSSDGRMRSRAARIGFLAAALFLGCKSQDDTILVVRVSLAERCPLAGRASLLRATVKAEIRPRELGRVSRQGRPGPLSHQLLAAAPPIGGGPVRLEVVAFDDAGGVIARSVEDRLEIRVGATQRRVGASSAAARAAAPTEGGRRRRTAPSVRRWRRRAGADAGAGRCGNGLLDEGELCDPAIPAGRRGACPPADCDDGLDCTRDVPVGSRLPAGVPLRGGHRRARPGTAAAPARRPPPATPIARAPAAAAPWSRARPATSRSPPSTPTPAPSPAAATTRTPAPATIWSRPGPAPRCCAHRLIQAAGRRRRLLSARRQQRERPGLPGGLRQRAAGDGGRGDLRPGLPRLRSGGLSRDLSRRRRPLHLRGAGRVGLPGPLLAAPASNGRWAATAAACPGWAGPSIPTAPPCVATAWSSRASSATRRSPAGSPGACPAVLRQPGWALLPGRPARGQRRRPAPPAAPRTSTSSARASRRLLPRRLHAGHRPGLLRHLRQRRPGGGRDLRHRHRRPGAGACPAAGRLRRRRRLHRRSAALARHLQRALRAHAGCHLRFGRLLPTGGQQPGRRRLPGQLWQPGGRGVRPRRPATAALPAGAPGACADRLPCPAAGVPAGYARRAARRPAPPAACSRRCKRLPAAATVAARPVAAGPPTTTARRSVATPCWRAGESLRLGHSRGQPGRLQLPVRRQRRLHAGPARWAGPRTARAPAGTRRCAPACAATAAARPAARPENDLDCRPAGLRQPGRSKPARPATRPAPAPTECVDDGDVCTTGLLRGTPRPAAPTASTSPSRPARARRADRCCPAGCVARTDVDCGAPPSAAHALLTAPDPTRSGGPGASHPGP